MIVIIDIDGTIADDSKDAKAAGVEPDRTSPEFATWLKRATANTANYPAVLEMKWLAQDLQDAGENCYYVTSRDEKDRSMTEEWLRKNGFPAFEAHMRAAGDTRQPQEMKAEVIQMMVDRHSEPVLVIDNDERMILTCRKNGWMLLAPYIP